MTTTMLRTKMTTARTSLVIQPRKIWLPDSDKDTWANDVDVAQESLGLQKLIGTVVKTVMVTDIESQ